MQLAVRHYVETSAGFRCVAATLKIFSSYFEINSMSHTTVRRWLLCYGYFLLKEEPVKKDGYWVVLNDFSIQLGKEKCLLTLGVPLEYMRQQGFNLTHKDVKVLDIFVTTQSSSMLVKERLDAVANRVGLPAQIVSDHGSDIKKGNELFCKDHPTVVYTYDISHKTGCLLKALLDHDSRWDSLLKTINIVLQQVQQTELSFLRPILPRKKSRYLNMGIIVNWVQNIIAYNDRQDFSLIESGYSIHPESIYQLTNAYSDKKVTTALLKMSGKKYKCQQDIRDELSSILPQEIEKKDIVIIDLSEQRFREKYGLFEQYRDFITDLSSMMAMIEKIQTIVKHRGLSNGTMNEIEQEMSSHEFKGAKSRLIYEQILDYLKEELSKFDEPEKAYLVCSDIEESIFGKFKYKLTERTGGIFRTVLLLCVLCSGLAIEQIKAACETFNMEDVDNFIKQMIGKSLLAKRRTAFSATT